MANIKMNIEAEVSDEVIAKFAEALGEGRKPPKEIQVELSELKGRMTIRLIGEEQG